jgi:holo-[acyl-carrier protein] synthase
MRCVGAFRCTHHLIAYDQLAMNNVLGIGTDIVECQRVAKMIEKHEDIFIQRVYTPEEIQYCAGRKSATQHYAGRWAAKEAILKAMGTGWAKGIQWTDIEIINQMGGKPIVRIGGEAKVICESKGISDILVSISHCRTFATAFATAVGSSAGS